MKQKKCIILALISLSFSVNAEVFKCKSPAGKVIYQAEPCASGAISQGVVDVKTMTPEEAEAANEKLKAWQQRQADEAEAKRTADKEHQAELQKQESLELQRRSVTAQERQATAAQQQPQQYNNGPLYVPAYDFNRYNRLNRLYPPHGGWDPYNYPRPYPYNGLSPNQASKFPPYKPYVAPPPPPFRASQPMAPNPQAINPGFGSSGFRRNDNRRY